MAFPAYNSSTWAYYGCLAVPGVEAAAGVMKIELYVGAIPADPALESDFTRPVYPGYAAIILNIPGTVVPDDPASAETVPCDPVTFQATGAPAVGTHATGWFCYDAAGNTMFYGTFSPGPWNIVNSGDFLTLSIVLNAFYFFV